MDRKTKIDFIKAVLSGNRNTAKKILLTCEWPLFWEKQSSFYVAGNLKLSVQEFEEIQKLYPCYIGGEEEKTY